MHNKFFLIKSLIYEFEMPRNCESRSLGATIYFVIERIISTDRVCYGFE